MEKREATKVFRFLIGMADANRMERVRACTRKIT